MATPGDLDPKVEALRLQGALNLQPEAVTDELFLAREFFDSRDLVQVKYEMLRRVQVDRKAVADTTATFGFSRPSFYRAAAAFEAEGIPGLLPHKRGPRGPHKMTPEIREFLQQKMADEPDVRTDRLVAQVEEQFGVRLHARTIERGMAAKKNR